MSTKCNFCINKDRCSECDPDRLDKFIPSKEIESYFEKGFVGSKRGIDNHIWYFNTTNEDLIPTHVIDIFGKHICPYCGEEMYPIQKPITLAVKGYCCICQGARDEIEFETKKRALSEKHAQEMSKLENEYHNKLLFCEDKLFAIKRAIEKARWESSDHNHSHTSTRNCETITDIDQLI